MKTTKNQPESTTHPILLMGTRNGDIIEATIVQTFTGVRTERPNPSNPNQISVNVLGSNANLFFEESDDSENTSDEEGGGPVIKKTEKINKEPEGTIALKYSLCTKHHSGPVKSVGFNDTYKKKVIFALHPHHYLLLTMGEDQRLCAWDLEKFRLVFGQNWGILATAMKYTPNGEHLVLGLQNGLVMIAKSKIKSQKSGKFNESKDCSLT